MGAGKSPSTSNSTSSSKLSLKFIINSSYLIHVWKVSSEMQREIRKKIQPMGKVQSHKQSHKNACGSQLSTQADGFLELAYSLCKERPYRSSPQHILATLCKPRRREQERKKKVLRSRTIALHVHLNLCTFPSCSLLLFSKTSTRNTQII